MTWESMLDEFRSLGGVAENVGLGPSSLGGTGLFPLDPARPVRLHVPPGLLVPSSEVTLDDRQRLVVKPGGEVGSREREFFAAYQERFSFGPASADIWRLMRGYAALPDAVAAALESMGGAPLGRFVPPAQERCLEVFSSSRQIRIDDRPCLMTVLDLVNHDAEGVPFDVRAEAGVGIAGRFGGEIRAVYLRPADSWHYALNWGFATPMPTANSMPLAIGFDDRRIVIRHRFKDADPLGPFRLPRRTVTEGAIELSFLVLGDQLRPRVPRSVFLRVMDGCGIAKPRLNELFELLGHLNRQRFIGLLGKLDGLPGALPAMLRRAILFQLESLSSCFGTRELA